MIPSISSFSIPLILFAQCLSAQDSSVLSASPQSSDLIFTSIPILPSSAPGIVISGAQNASATASSRFSSSSTTEDLTAIAGLPTSSPRSNGTASATTAARPRPTNTTPCNGYPEFCNRKFSNISMVVAHNSPFVREHNAASNQMLPVLNQLNDGIRGCRFSDNSGV
jgi:hypothetical protein